MLQVCLDLIKRCKKRRQDVWAAKVKADKLAQCNLTRLSIYTLSTSVFWNFSNCIKVRSWQNGKMVKSFFIHLNDVSWNLQHITCRKLHAIRCKHSAWILCLRNSNLFERVVIAGFVNIKSKDLKRLGEAPNQSSRCVFNRNCPENFAKNAESHGGTTTFPKLCMVLKEVFHEIL